MVVSPIQIPQHEHLFGATEIQPAERRTRWVILLTFCMMVAELIAGTLFGSMALLADGWHMGTHVAALGITAFAYAFARKHARNPRFSFGTGKVGALGGFGSAITLAMVAVLVLAESVQRFWEPVEIQFEEAIVVAVIGLLVNILSAWLLRGVHDHGHDHEEPGHDHGHDHEEAGHDHEEPGHDHGHDHDHEEPGHESTDHNLRGAYLHVLADAATSVAAIGALTVGKLFGWMWVDAATGILGSLVIGVWALGLIRQSGAVLLDAEVSAKLRSKVVASLESDGETRIVDLHLWCVGVGKVAAIAALQTTTTESPESFRRRLEHLPELVHVTVELNPPEN